MGGPFGPSCCGWAVAAGLLQLGCCGWAVVAGLMYWAVVAGLLWLG